MEDYLDWKKAYWQNLLEEFALDPSSFKHILDAGCGPAGIFILDLPGRVDALDPLLASYDSLPHFDRSRYSRVHWFEQRLEDFRSENSYDMIFCLNAINHVEDMEKALQVLAKALRPGGKMLLSTDAHNHKVLKQLFRLIPGDILHPQQYDFEEYLEFCRKAGLKCLQSRRHRREFIFDYHVMLLQHE